MIDTHREQRRPRLRLHEHELPERGERLHHRDLPTRRPRRCEASPEARVWHSYVDLFVYNLDFLRPIASFMQLLPSSLVDTPSKRGRCALRYNLTVVRYEGSRLYDSDVSWSMNMVFTLYLVPFAQLWPVLRPSDHGWLGRAVIVLSFDRQQGNFSAISSIK